MSFNFKRIKEIGVLLFLFSVFLYFQILSLKEGGWLADEIFHINFLGEWLKDNLWGYISQSQHEIFPPRSPIFGNPPLSFLLMSLAMKVGSFFDISYLISARIMALFFGSMSFFLVFAISKKIFKDYVVFLPVIFFSFFPAITVLNSTAYIDGFLIFSCLLFWYFLIQFQNTKKRRYFYLLAISFGAGFLVKYQFIMMAIPFLIIFYLYNRKNIIIDAYDWLLFSVVAYVTAGFLWAGFRDLSQVSSALFWITRLFDGSSSSLSGGMFSDYANTEGGEISGFLYYFYQFFGKAPTLVILGVLFSLIFFRFQKNDKVFFQMSFLGTFFPILVFGILGGVPNTIHRIGMVLPFSVFLASFGWKLIFEFVKGKYGKGKGEKINKAVFILLIFSSVIGMAAISPKFYNLSTNYFNQYFNSTGTKFRNGDGEGMKEVAQWFEESGLVNENSIIGVARFRYVLNKYFPGSYLTDFPLDGECNYAWSRGIDYVVLHSSHYTGELSPDVIYDNECFDLKKTFRTAKTEMAKVYQVKDGIGKEIVEKKSFFWPEKSWINTKTKDSQLKFIRTNNGRSVVFDYRIKAGDWIFSSANIGSSLKRFDGIEFTIETKERQNNALHLDFLGGSEDGSYLRHSLSLNFKGKKKIYIDFSQLYLVGEDFDYNVGLSDKVKVSFDSINDLQNEVKISDINFFILDKY